MPQIERTYHCVCGNDVPFVGDPAALCTRCGRRQQTTSDELLAAAETVVTPRDVPPGAAGAIEEIDDESSLVGRTLDHFDILEAIGRGGMGVVYRAIDRSLERYVALKVISRGATREELLEAFVHEARSQARINHEGVATLYYVGRHEGRPYFAMEYVPGEDLYTRVTRDGPLPFAQVVEIGLQLVRALREANARGITHRDIKPANVILTPSGRAKLTDFGLAKAEAADVSRAGGLPLSDVHSFAGSPHYISPEQSRSESTDLRSDIYSLGATLYHLAYGRPPFDAPSAMAVVAKHLAEPLSFPRHPPSGVSFGFPAVLERMLAKSPRDRFQSYDRLERALLAVRPEAQRPATLAQRFLGALVDWALVCVFFGVGFLVVGAFLSRIVERDPSRNFEQAIAPYLTVIFGTPFLVHVLWQVLFRRSPGKHVARVVIAGRRTRPSRIRLAARSALQLLPLATLAVASLVNTLADEPETVDDVVLVLLVVSLVDHLWIFANRPRRALRDVLLGTHLLRETPRA